MTLYIDIGGVLLCLLSVNSLFVFVIMVYGLLKDSDLITSLSRDKMQYLNHCVVWVVGATSSIGQALSYHLIKRGAYVILSDVAGDPLTSICNRCRRLAQGSGYDSYVYELDFDFGKLEEFEEIVGKALKWRNRIDCVFVHTGGSGQLVALSDQCFDRDIIYKHYVSIIKLFKCLYPHFLSRNKGQFIDISSESARCYYGGSAAFCASKAGVKTYFQSINHELKYYGQADAIKISSILVGPLKDEESESLQPIDHKSMSGLWRNKTFITPQRCSELIYKVASNNIAESWIARRSDLICLYLAYYVPQWWSFVYQKILQDTFMQGVALQCGTSRNES